jgi:flagellar basal body L-ring protein FlgH
LGIVTSKGIRLLKVSGVITPTQMKLLKVVGIVTSKEIKLLKVSGIVTPKDIDILKALTYPWRGAVYNPELNVSKAIEASSRFSI